MPRFWAYKALIFKGDSYFNESGWNRSFVSGHPSSKHGEPIPWMNYAIVSFLNERLGKEMSLFEFGSGFSTEFYAARCTKVVSIESSREWYEKVKRTVGDNAEVRYVPADDDGEYCRAIHEFDGAFDVVIVDGRDRVNCVKHAVSKLAPGGVLILDDSQRGRYNEAWELMADKGFRSITFEGIVPMSVYGVSSTVFYRADNVFGI